METEPDEEIVTVAMPASMARLVASLLLAFDLYEAAEGFAEMQRPCIFVSADVSPDPDTECREWFIRAPKNTFAVGDLVMVRRRDGSNPVIVQLTGLVRTRRLYEWYTFENV